MASNRQSVQNLTGNLFALGQTFRDQGLNELAAQRAQKGLEYEGQRLGLHQRQQAEYERQQRAQQLLAGFGNASDEFVRANPGTNKLQAMRMLYGKMGPEDKKLVDMYYGGLLAQEEQAASKPQGISSLGQTGGFRDALSSPAAKTAAIGALGPVGGFLNLIRGHKSLWRGGKRAIGDIMEELDLQSIGGKPVSPKYLTELSKQRLGIE